MVNPMQDALELDWEALWHQAFQRKWAGRGDRARYWNRRAPSFPCPDQPGAFAQGVVDLLAPEPDWTVLDVGCGTGTLALPLAGRVRSVTAMDFSEGMLDGLRRRSAGLGLTNLQPLLGAWEDDWSALGIGCHDVGIASRSMAVEDLAGAIRKLNNASRRKACIVSTVGDGPHDRAATEAIGRPFRAGPDYIYVVNLLHQFGIYAHVAILEGERERCFAGPGEALDIYRALLENLTPGEENDLRAYLARELVEQQDTWRLRRGAPIRWAAIWWEKEKTL